MNKKTDALLCWAVCACWGIGGVLIAIGPYPTFFAVVGSFVLSAAFGLRAWLYTHS